MENSKTDFVTVLNSILLLIDYQTNIINGIASGDRTEIKKAVVASARAAGILNVPIVMTSINTKENGEVIKELRDLFPGKEVITRLLPLPDAFEDERVLQAVRKSGRQKLVIAGLWTSTCFANTAIHAIQDGLDVYGLIDAAGDTTLEAHNSGVQRMLEAGVTPITWMSLTAEWMNSGSNSDENEVTNESYGKYSAMLSYLANQQPLFHYK